MQRRSMLKAAASFALLATPRLAKTGSPTTLRFVPVSGLVILDPVSTTGRATRNHGFLVFDTLYGLDETLSPQPQMVAGHTIEEHGKRWTLTLREQLRFHDGEKVRAGANTLVAFHLHDPGQGVLATGSGHVAGLSLEIIVGDFDVPNLQLEGPVGIP